MQILNKLNRGIVLLSLLAFVGAVGCSDSPSGSSTALVQIPATADVTAGEVSYDAQCQGCHGDMGQGNTAPALDAFTTDSTIGIGLAVVPLNFANLDEKIRLEMPPFPNSDTCVGTCASNVAAYIYCQWNGELVSSGCPVIP